MTTELNQLSVFNRALSELSQEPISDVTVDTDNAAILRNNYTFALEIALASHHWDFATAYTTLPLISAATNITPFEYLHGLPEDFIAFQKIYDAQTMDSESSSIPHERTSNGLYTNSNPTYLKYTKRIDNISLTNSAFCESVALHLAELCAAKILGSTNREDFLGQQAGKAQAIAANQSVGRAPKSYKTSSTWVDVRLR